MVERELHRQPDDRSWPCPDSGKHSADCARYQIPASMEPVGFAPGQEVQIRRKRFMAGTGGRVQQPELARGDPAKPDLWRGAGPADPGAPGPAFKLWGSVALLSHGSRGLNGFQSV